MLMRASFRNLARITLPCIKRYISGMQQQPTRTTALFKDLVQLPGNSELRLVKMMATKRPTQIAEILELEHQPPHVRRLWEDVLAARGFADILLVLKTVGFEASESVGDIACNTQSSRQIFTLLVLHIFLNRANTPGQLIQALMVLQDHLPTAPLSLQPVLIIVAVAKLAELRLIATLRRLVQDFQELQATTAAHYRIILRALSLAPKSKETSALATELFSTMTVKGYALRHANVYHALLRPSFLTLDVAEGIEQKMAADRMKPEVHYLLALFRLMVKRGFRRRASRYMSSLDSASRSSVSPRHASRLAHPKRSAKWQHLYIAAYRDTAAAYRYIKQMPTKRSSADATPSSPTNTLLPARLSQSRRSMTGRNFGRAAPDDDLQLQHGLEFPTPADAQHYTTPSIRSDAPPVPPEWLSVLQVAGKDAKLSARALILIFRKGGRQYLYTLSAYEILIRGLLRKQDFTRAAAVWHELHNQGWALGRRSLGIGVRALASAGQCHKAFALLEEAHAGYEARTLVTEISGKSQIKSKPVSVEGINHFMVALRHRGRPDAIFSLWDAMEVLYGLAPDVYTLNIMLGAARWSRKYDQSLKGAFRSVLSGFGLSRARWVLPAARNTATAEENRKEVASYIAAMLDPERSHNVTGQWGSEAASRAALRIAVQMFLGNWPHLKSLRPPVRAIRKAGSDPALSPLSDLFHSLSQDPSDGIPPLTILLRLLPENIPPYPYPYIYPTDFTFRAFLDLLACESLHTEIPVALTWMRALGVWPSKTTLATALVHWGEVSMDAPLIERFKGGPARSPYSMLMAWMKSWVGEEHMPTRVEMMDEMARLAFYRHARYDDRRGFILMDSSGQPMKRGQRRR
ncbi:hypothetical protein BC835DRAFT_1357621 [Cytidiella melzeri]|nr:hypothetical protein BC835DRAFT_1357621 [Cytidiella melzeri]